MKRNYSVWALCLSGLLATVPALAHRSHCHLKNAQGKLVDGAQFKSEKHCTDKGGEWKHHHDHCHKPGTEHVDMPDLKKKKACLAGGGVWNDHGHEEGLADAGHAH